ncbi:MAG: type II toxin-antitoxin system Phd/YefM family antitoxin [Deltaproteobacteria bacterium]|nr:type II toxin-antitoxin system Phd/YefM family antitoxin [Deltaproteobacteria bacterium]
MRLAKAIKPITYLKNHTADVVREVVETGGQMVITQNGEAKAVLMDVATWDRWQETLAMLKIIAQSDREFREGRGETTDQVFARVRAAMKKARDERS